MVAQTSENSAISRCNDFCAGLVQTCQMRLNAKPQKNVAKSNIHSIHVQSVMNLILGAL